MCVVFSFEIFKSDVGAGVEVEGHNGWYEWEGGREGDKGSHVSPKCSDDFGGLVQNGPVKRCCAIL